MDIKDFLVSLSRLGSARFVLSFQYEVIYAYRERSFFKGNDWVVSISLEGGRR